MKRRSLAILLILLIALLTPFTEIKLVPSSSVTSDQIIGKLQPPEVTIIEENETGITLKVDFFGFQRSQVEEDDLVLDVLTILGCGSMEEIGKPALPKYGTVLTVPFDVDFHIYVLENESTNYDDYLVYPAQEPAPDVIDEGFEFPTPPFYINRTFYDEFNDWYPKTIVEYEAAGTLGDVRVLPLRFLAFQHNPVAGVLRFYWNITVRIDYITQSVLMSETSLATPAPSPYFESFYSSLLGYEQLTMREAGAQGAVLEPEGASVPGWDFLIITDLALLDAANTLAARRNAEGLSTRVVTTNETGGTAADIKAYIQNAYDTWDPRPSYLLLLGDAEVVPTFYRTTHPYFAYPANTLIGTDLYYAILNGPEAAPPFYSEYWTPDIFYGRIPVDNLAQANLVINKIMEYEDRQWMSLNDVPGTALVAGYFQDDDPNGYEDRRFILTLEEIRDFLLGKGFDVERLYQTHSWVTPTNYNNGPYDAGSPLPDDLRRPTYPWGAKATDIKNAINDGRFVVFHRDHGGSANSGVPNGWGHPYYLGTDVAALNNADHFTVVFTINCETGWFDGETDTFPAVSFESLSEALLRESDGGAVGVVGATRVSYSGHNDVMAKGFVDAVWPNFDPARGPAGAQLRMGEVLNYGKLYYRQFYGAYLIRKVEYEIFHYFGDPTMVFKIPTLDTVPPTVTITYPPDGAEFEADQIIDVQYTISDNNDPNPTVVVTPSDPILPPLTVGSLTITVTATDFAGNVGSASVTLRVKGKGGEGVPLWVLGVVTGIAVIGMILGIFFLRRRRSVKS